MAFSVLVYAISHGRIGTLRYLARPRFEAREANARLSGA